MEFETFSVYSADELTEKVRECSCRALPTLGILFVSPALGIPSIADSVRGFGFPVFGCSTAGEILTGQGQDPVFEQSAVCCLLHSSPSSFSVRLFEREGITSFDLGKRVGSWGAEVFEHPLFIIAVSGLTNDGEAIIKGMMSSLPKGTIIIGGVAADDNALEKTLVFSHENMTEDGAVALVMDAAQISLSSFTTSGWKGIGAGMTVTASEGNVVKTIDGKPPIDLLAEYLNIRKEDVVPTALSFPMLVQRPDGCEVLRTALSADFETGTLTYAGSVPQGATIRFSSSFGGETIETTIRDLKAGKAQHPDADLILLFSCCARHQAAGNQIVDEIRVIADLWKVPVIGFFTYGEIGHTSSDACDFFNETISLALIRFGEM